MGTETVRFAVSMYRGCKVSELRATGVLGPVIRRSPENSHHGADHPETEDVG